MINKRESWEYHVIKDKKEDKYLVSIELNTWSVDIKDALAFNINKIYVTYFANEVGGEVVRIISFAPKRKLYP